MTIIIKLVISWTIYSLGLSPLITKPTRLTFYSTTLIDNIFTNINDYALMSCVMVLISVFICQCILVKKSLIILVNRYL